jgi:hypothetical protein
MTALLGTIAEDPRTGLKAGTKDAGQAIKGLTLVAALPKPTGFFDPKNPYELPQSALRPAAAPAVVTPAAAPAGATPAATPAAAPLGNRSPLLDFARPTLPSRAT